VPGLNRQRPTTIGRFRLDGYYVENSHGLACRLRIAALVAAHTGHDELTRELGEGVVRGGVT